MLLKNLNTPEGRLARQYEEKVVRTKTNTSRRTKPMRILVFGSARTGTTSLLTALDMLGYRTYHMHELFKHPSQFKFWIKAIRAKFGGTDSTLPNFDEVVGDFDAVSDVPIALFTPELLAAYPDAKVILITRLLEKWGELMCSTIWRAHSWWSWDWIALFNPGLIQGFRTCDTLVWDAFMNSTADQLSLSPARRDYFTPEYRELAMQRFQEHNDFVKSLVPQDKLLEFQPQHGWKPLCGFLGLQVPEGDYPRANQKDDHIRVTTLLWFFGFTVAILKIMGVLVLVSVCVWLIRNYLS